MRTLVRLPLVCVLLVAMCVLVLPAPMASAKPPAPPPPPPPPPDLTYPACGFSNSDRYTGTLTSGAAYLICIPHAHFPAPLFGWNGNLVVYAHGYAPHFTVATTPQFQDLNLGGSYVPNAVEQLGYAFAATNYRDTGLVVIEAQEDLIQLVDKFISIRKGVRPARVILAGASEGGWIGTLLAENPDRKSSGKRAKTTRYFDGVLAACGPIGSFQEQTDYLGKFRVLWDALYVTEPLATPPYIPDTPISIREDLVVPESGSTTPTDPWRAIYKPYILDAVMPPGATTPPDRAQLLLGAAGAAWDTNDPSTAGDTAQQILWYNIFATNDAAAKLGRNFFNQPNTEFLYNEQTIAVQYDETYTRNDNTNALMETYNTTGHTKIPLVTLHTTGDPVVPIWHEDEYADKLERAATDHAPVQQIAVTRYGHCNFTANEVIGAFNTLVGMLP